MSDEKQWDRDAINVLRAHVEAERKEADTGRMPERVQTLEFVDELLRWMVDQPVTNRGGLGEAINTLINADMDYEGSGEQRDRIVKLLNILRRY